MIIFETDRLRVRQYNTGDEENFFLLNGDPEVVRYIRAPKSREECVRFLAEVINHYQEFPLYGRWAVDDKLTNSFVGSFSILHIEDTELMHLGYALLPAYWGKGYATELAKAGINYVFSKTILTSIYAICEPENLSSIRILEKTGFKFETSYADKSGKNLNRYRVNKY